MSGRYQGFIRLGVASLATACVTMGVMLLFEWSMTEYVILPAHVAFPASGLTLIAGVVGALLVLAMLAILARFRPVGPGTAGLLGAVLLWLIGYATSLEAGSSLLLMPGGLTAGLILGRARTDTRIIGRKGGIALIAGLTLWIGWLAMSAVYSWQERNETITPPPPPILGAVTGGAAWGGELWLVDQRGRTVSFRLTDWHPTRRSASGVVAVVPSGGTMWALQAAPFDWRADEQRAARFRLAGYSDGHWRYSAWQDYGRGERPLALVVGPQGPIVVGPNRLYRFGSESRPAMTRLDTIIKANGRFVAALVGGDTLYLGINHGEWGGGLRRITVSTGAVTTVERTDDPGSCSGPLDSQCDPVTGLVPDRNRPGCVFASIGLSHLISHGRVIRVCGERVETVLAVESMPIGVRIQRALSAKARKFRPMTEAMFGLAPAVDGFWAVSPKALYHGNGSRMDRLALPKLVPPMA